jgi:hypothetical protein
LVSGHRSWTGDAAVPRDPASGLVQDQPWRETAYCGAELLIGCVGHLDQQGQCLVGVGAQGALEGVEVELADLGGELCEPGVLREV